MRAAHWCLLGLAALGLEAGVCATQALANLGPPPQSELPAAVRQVSGVRVIQRVREGSR